jgi:poly(beta-D-mannuronate) lyase
MKKNKLINLLLIFLLLISLVACTETDPLDDNYNSSDEVVLTDFEKVNAAKEALDIGDISAVTSNLVLPDETLYFVQVSWESSDRDIINEDGIVSRPEYGEGDAIITLTATLSFNSNTDTKLFQVVVLEMPDGAAGQVQEATTKLILMPGDTVYTDYLILPRISTFASQVSWETSDDSIIDLDGHVYQSDTQTLSVTLTATITLEDATETKAFNLTVEPKGSDPATGVETITEFDSRILRIVSVSNKIEFLSAALSAIPGDAIVLEDGRYANVSFVMDRSGTEENPIFILASNPGGARIEGESTIRVEADHVIIANLLFQNGFPASDKGGIVLEGDYLRLTNTKFFEFELSGYDYKWVSSEGMYHEIDRNTFDGKTTGGALLTVWRDNDDPQFTHIHDNLFQNYFDTGGANGYETIRLGTSQQSQSDSYILVENNLFNNLNGEIEIVSVKSGRVMLRDNTVISSKGMFTLRHGKNSVIENNVFLTQSKPDAGGVRFYDGGHVIRNNYIEGVDTSSNTRGAIVIHSGVNVPGTDTTMNAQWTSFDSLIINNTIINSRQSIMFGGKYTHPTLNPTLINNYIYSPTYPIARYDKLPTNSIWQDNHFYGPSFEGGGAYSLTAIPDGVDFQTTLPEISRNDQNLYLHDSYGAQNLTVLSESEVGSNF